MRTPEPFTTNYRKDNQTFQFTLNPACGLPPRVCLEWRRRSFLSLPDDLANYRNPKTDKAAQAGVKAFITYLIKKQAEEGSARRVSVEDITVGAWIEKFTELDTSPRTGINASKNRPYSLNTIDSYRCYFNCHIKGDPICKLKMSEVEDEDVLEYITRLSVKRFIVKKDSQEVDGGEIGGSHTFSGVISLMRMAFTEYQTKAKKWFNPFQYLKAPKNNKRSWDALSEDEVLKLFQPGVLIETMELAVCAAMFLSGLRRGELYALRPEDLDWKTPKIMVCRAWQRFNKKDKKMGPTKGKKVRQAPFDPILQQAIKKLWKENGEHEYVFSHKNGKSIGTSWLKRHFPKWLERAGIELNGRRIVPYSSHHSLASLLEARGVSLRYIQELLGHSDLKTTKIYLHSTEKTIREIGSKISAAMEQKQKPEETKAVPFKVSYAF
jgi:integrase/recombinase XerD